MGAAQKQGDISQLDLQHPYLRNCKTKTTSSGVQLIATIPAQMPTYKKWKEELQALNSSFPQLPFLLLPLRHKFEDGGVCSTSGELTLEYEYYPRLLSSEIASRKKESKKFTEGELWYLLYALAIAKFELAQNGQPVGDIHPKNIFLNGTGEVKIGCLRSWPGQVNNYRKAILEQQCGYLAPQDIDRLKLGAMDNQVNAESEIFAIGLVLLSSATLQMQQDLYEMREREFEDDIFYSRVGKFQHDSLYSEIFRGVVSNLLETDPLKRMNVQELKTFLEKHQENILAKRPLRIDNATRKLQKTIKQMFILIHNQPITEKQSNKVAPQLPPPSLPVSPKQIIQTNVKQSIRTSKIQNVINYEQKRPSSQSRIEIPANPLPPQKINSNPIIPQLPANNTFFYNQLPPFIPVTINPNPNEEPHRPVINKVFSSSITSSMIKKSQPLQIQSPKYRPFESISVSRERDPPFKKQQLKELIVNLPLQYGQSFGKEVNTISNNKLNKLPEKETLTPNTQMEIKSEPYIGHIKDTTVEIFQYNCLINPNYEPQCVDTVPIASNHSEGPQVVHEESQEDDLESRRIEEQNEENEGRSTRKTPVDELLMRSRKDQNNSIYSNSILKNNSKQSYLSQKEREQNQIQANHEVIQPKEPQKEILAEQQQASLLNQDRIASLQQNQQAKPKSSGLSSKHQQFHQNQINKDISPIFQAKEQPNLRQQIRNLQKDQAQKKDTKQIDEPKPINEQVKRQFKVQILELTNTNQSKSLSPTVKVWGLKPALNTPSNTTNIKQINTLPQKKISQSESHKQSERQSKNIDNVGLIIDLQQVPNTKTQVNEAEQGSQKEQLQKMSKKGADNYILIEQDSRHTIQRLNNEPQVQVQRQTILQQESQIISYHTYLQVATDGNFQECWAEILMFLKDPTEYSTILDPEKVKIRIEEDSWSLKVGPGIFDILLNKEEGKFLLRNCVQESQCRGEMLGGVYKDEQKRHRIWFNSAYYYKGKRIPSRQLIEECLDRFKANIAKLKK